jgi:hypothetical protein
VSDEDFNYIPHLDNPNELSINEYCAQLPKRRWGHEAKGKILFFPRTQITGVPVEMRQGGGWNVVVVHSDHPSYPVGGYNLYVSECEIVTALEFYWYLPIEKQQLVPISYREPDPNSPFTKVMNKVNAGRNSREM